jgi:hypothetical protein
MCPFLYPECGLMSDMPQTAALMLSENRNKVQKTIQPHYHGSNKHDLQGYPLLVGHHLDIPYDLHDIEELSDRMKPRERGDEMDC